MGAFEHVGMGESGARVGRQMLAAETPPFAVSPAQSGVRIDSPALRMNGAPTQLFQIDFGKATAELNPIKLFTITGALECVSGPDPTRARIGAASLPLGFCGNTS